MAIKSLHIVGIAGAFALVGAGLWASSAWVGGDDHSASVEVQQVQERSWAVEITDLGPTDGPAPTRTASAN